MPQLYNVQVYSNTGYNRANIPDKPGRLEGLPYESYEAVWEWQSYGLARVKLSATWEQICDADYLVMTGEDGKKTYYVIDGISMESPKTASLSLLLDPWNTAGGIDVIKIIGGWCKRAHTGRGEDKLFSNLLPEPWSPSDRLIIREKNVIHETTGKNARLAVATCDLGAAEKFAAKIAEASDGAISGSVVWPELPLVNSFPKTGTELAIEGSNQEEYAYELPGMWTFYLDNEDVLAGISAVRSLGIESSIVSMYVVPEDDVRFRNDVPQGKQPIGGIIGRKNKYSPQQPYIYGNPKNTKACTLYNVYILASMATGNKAEFEAKDLWENDEGTSPTWATYADPSAGGTVYAQPETYEGSQTMPMEQAVASAPWLTAGYIYQQSSGGALTLANAQRETMRAAYDYHVAAKNYDLNLAQQAEDAAYYEASNAGTMGLIKMIGNIATGNFTGPAQQLLDISHARSQYMTKAQMTINDANAMEQRYKYGMGERFFSANVSANLVAPTLAFPVSVNAASFFGHRFMAAHVTLTDEDVARFDLFLTRYGYAQDRPLKQEDFKSRQNHNYIMAESVQLDIPNAPRYIREAIEDMLAAGIRLWHVNPSQAALDTNNVL